MRAPGPSRLLLAWLLAAAGVAPATAGAQQPLTRPERTEWLETSRYADVMAFIAALDSPLLHSTHFGYSHEGRRLPLVVVGRGLPDGSAEAVRSSDRLRVLILANIHGGEVEGKEAAQMLLRDLASGAGEGWLDSLVVLVAPIYNADGNERVAVTNRSRQNGPHGGVGERANAQGLDLNRDHMKLETSEARSLAGLLGSYDPHVVVDLHTTNGTRHAYHLTYASPLHPATDRGIVEYLRDEWLPAVTRSVEEARGWHMYHYGNAYTPEGGEEGWYTFDHRPRFNNNYVGLRNRFAILSEAYSYASFADRIAATRAFVDAILDFAAAHASEVRRRVEAADAAPIAGREVPVRATFSGGGTTEILMGDTEERLSPYSGSRYEARLDVVRPTPMVDFTTFRGTESVRAPSAYYVPAELHAVLDLLALHGVRTEPARSGEAGLERFTVDSTRVAEREFQGHLEREVFGRWEPAPGGAPAGSRVVPVDQPLGRLVVQLLEPRADDGVVAWNRVDADLEEGRYPILRRPAPGAWEDASAPTDAEFRGLSAAADAVWATGRGGVWARSPDGGVTWTTGVLPDGESLFAVDVHAGDGRVAHVLATHFDGGLARIYRTEDGGVTWTRTFEDDREGAFYDGLAFWSPDRGVAFGDALDGRMTIVRTEDGERWLAAETVPPALEGEGGFAASGTAIAVAGDRHAWIGTGAGPRARVLRTGDGGRSWTVAETPLPAGPTAGIFGIAFRDTLNGVAVGGDYRDTTSTALNVVRTRDGGRTWELISRTAPAGVRYGVAYASEPGAVEGSAADVPALLAVGPSGSGISFDDGETWTPLDDVGYNAVAFSPSGVAWVAGVRGRVARRR